MVQNELVEHFAARLDEYLIMNVTTWSADAILYQMLPILKIMDHERSMNWMQEENFIREQINGATFQAQEGLFTNKTIGMLWQKLRPVRRLAKGKNMQKYDPI